MDIINKLTETFKDFPGIGERQARRFVYFLMSKNPNYSKDLAGLIQNLKNEIARCKECFRFYILTQKTGEYICETCEKADGSTLLVLEKDSDLESIEKSGEYHGKYFLLGGLVPIVEKKTPSYVRIEELKKRIQNSGDLKEIILAFSISPQGDHTDHYLRGELESLLKDQNTKISSLGKGLSTGTELEYSDNDTIKNALKNRQ